MFANVTSVSVRDQDGILNQLGIGSDPDLVWDPASDPGMSKLSPKKEKLKSIVF
jgi:hypothetical protein